MCVIVYQPAGERLARRDAAALWKQNPDGGGIAYIHRDRVITRKAMTFRQWWHVYQTATKAEPESPFLLHMRIATHGAIDKGNTHPFQVDKHTVLAHNGILWDCVPAKWDKRSDTRVFVDDFLSQLPKGWLDNPHLSMMVEAFTVGNRLMFLTVDPDLSDNVYLLGEWENHKGLRMSNTYGLRGRTIFQWAGHSQDKPFTFDEVRNYEWSELNNKGEWVEAKSDPDDSDDWLTELEQMRGEFDYLSDEPRPWSL